MLPLSFSFVLSKHLARTTISQRQILQTPSVGRQCGLRLHRSKMRACHRSIPSKEWFGSKPHIARLLLLCSTTTFEVLNGICIDQILRTQDTIVYVTEIILIRPAAPYIIQGGRPGSKRQILSATGQTPINVSEHSRSTCPC